MSQYATSQVSSACSCLSVPTTTSTYTASTSTVVSCLSQKSPSSKSNPYPSLSLLRNSILALYNTLFNLLIQYSVKTTYSTTTATDACATGTIYPGAHLVTGQFADAYQLNLGSGFSPYDCCRICDGGGSQGPFASCVGWAWLNSNCTSVLEGAPSTDYMQPPCTHYGHQPGTIYVDKAKYPKNVGGKGQCASSLTVVNG